MVSLSGAGSCDALLSDTSLLDDLQFCRLAEGQVPL